MSKQFWRMAFGLGIVFCVWGHMDHDTPMLIIGGILLGIGSGQGWDDK